MMTVFLSRTRKRRRVAFFTNNNNTLFCIRVVSIRIVFLINKLESLFFTERVLKRLLLNVCMLKVEREENDDAHCCDSTHYYTTRISLLSEKKKILSS